MLVKPKHIFVLIAASILCGIVLFLASPRPAEQAGPAISWEQVTDDPNKTISLVWLGRPNTGNTEKTWIQQRLEQQFNVVYQPIFLDWNANLTRRPLMFCGGDVPDVFWEGDPLDVRRSVQQGFVLEVPYELVLKHAPTYVQNLNRYGREAWLYARWCGKNWGVPTYDAFARNTLLTVWRMDWLRNVGIAKVPETLEEFHEALWRFTHQDPDRNGRNDTYGLSPELHWSLNFADIFAAFNILPGDLMLRDWKVVWGGILPEAKEVLALLRRWYSEGLIDPDYVVEARKQNNCKSLFTNGRIGFWYGMQENRDMDPTEPSSMSHVMRELQPQAELALGKPLIGINGRRRIRVWGGAAHVICFGSHLARQPEKVLRVLHMLETLACDQELAMEATTGRRGVHWEFTPDRGLFFLPPYDTTTGRMRNLFWRTTGISFFSPCGNVPDLYNKYEQLSSLEITKEYRRAEWGIQNVLGKSDVVDSAGAYLADLRELQATAYAQIIRGVKDLDYFDEFVKQWKARGGDAILKEANEMLRTKEDIYQKVGAVMEAQP